MEIDFEKLMAAKSAEDLQKYMTDNSRYTPEAISAAINELRKRGRVFTETELIKINSDIEQKKENDNNNNFTFDWKKNVVTDIDAPLFYSERVIWYFSILFGVITGGVLLSINLKKLNKKKVSFFTLLFGIIYSIFTIWIIGLISEKTKSTSGLTIGFNGVGAFVLHRFFWRKYIGKDTKYRARPFWGPLVICIVFATIIILATIYSS